MPKLTASMVATATALLSALSVLLAEVRYTSDAVREIAIGTDGDIDYRGPRSAIDQLKRNGRREGTDVCRVEERRQCER
jgi:hypothetical protein